MCYALDGVASGNDPRPEAMLYDSAGTACCLPDRLVFRVHQEKGHAFARQQLQDEGANAVNCFVNVQLGGKLVHDCHRLCRSATYWIHQNANQLHRPASFPSKVSRPSLLAVQLPDDFLHI